MLLINALGGFPLSWTAVSTDEEQPEKRNRRTGQATAQKNGAGAIAEEGDWPQARAAKHKERKVLAIRRCLLRA